MHSIDDEIPRHPSQPAHPPRDAVVTAATASASDIGDRPAKRSRIFNWACGKKHDDSFARPFNAVLPSSPPLIMANFRKRARSDSHPLLQPREPAETAEGP